MKNGHIYFEIQADDPARGCRVGTLPLLLGDHFWPVLPDVGNSYISWNNLDVQFRTAFLIPASDMLTQNAVVEVQFPPCSVSP